MTFDEFLAEQLATDPEFRALWEAEEPLYRVMSAFHRLRIQRDWTQRRLANQLRVPVKLVREIEEDGRCSEELLERVHNLLKEGGDGA